MQFSMQETVYCSNQSTELYELSIHVH